MTFMNNIYKFYIFLFIILSFCLGFKIIFKFIVIDYLKKNERLFKKQMKCNFIIDLNFSYYFTIKPGLKQ